LSGGQKARLVIARAVYARKEVMVFDDVFSGLDTTTETKVFERLFDRQGLLRKWGTTVVMATHAVNILPQADQIIALGSDGAISEQGTFAELNSRDGYVRSFCLEYARDNEKTSESIAEGKP
jgi:ATP-binding cassette subfamily C (CFTR/MRP) protein 1